jgi:hypothetical protein
VERSRSFESIAVMKPLQVTLTGAGEPERLNGQYVSADYFRVLGVRPALGRDFQQSDDGPWRPQGPIVAIISDGVWHRRFGGDPGDRRAADCDSGHPRNDHRRPSGRIRECFESDGRNLVDPAVRHLASA